VAILKFKFIKGDPLNGIREPNKAFISQSTAKKYFGNKNPIGQSISLDKKTDYLITGIFADIPDNSHLKFDILLSWENLVKLYGPDYLDAWGHTGSFTYIHLKPDADPIAFEEKLIDLVEEGFGEALKAYKMEMFLKMQPVQDIHLNSHYMQEYEINGNKTTIASLTLIAFFIIIIAWVNYINLSTARATTRAREVGMRKVVGASRGQLIIQFFIETILLNLFAFVLALLIVELLRPLFCNFTGIPDNLTIWSQSWFWPTLTLLFAGSIFLSGLYPVLSLSAFKPVTVLKGFALTPRNGINLRKALFIFQLTMSLVLIISTLTIFQQISFMQNIELGFDSEQILVFKTPRVRSENPEKRFDSFKNELLKSPNIRKVCHVTEVPGRQLYWDAGAIKKAGEDDSKGKNYQIIGIDFEFARVFDLKFVAGRNFSKKYPTDKEGLIFNETAVKWMGFESSEKAVGEKVDYWGQIFTIVGVVQDYHQQSPKAAFEPQIYRFLPTGRGVRGLFAAKMSARNSSENVQKVKRAFTKFFPGNPYDYFFLDDYFNQQYQADRFFGKVFSFFAILALVVTALGIFGMSSFNIAKRTKEIGIRKALGASISRILILLSKEYITGIIVASLIAGPIAWIATNQWLQNFANRISIAWWVYPVAAISALLVAYSAVCYQAYRAASANPVQALRYE